MYLFSAELASSLYSLARLPLCNWDLFLCISCRDSFCWR